MYEIKKIYIIDTINIIPVVMIKSKKGWIIKYLNFKILENAQ